MPTLSYSLNNSLAKYLLSFPRRSVKISANTMKSEAEMTSWLCWRIDDGGKEETAAEKRRLGFERERVEVKSVSFRTV